MMMVLSLSIVSALGFLTSSSNNHVSAFSISSSRISITTTPRVTHPTHPNPNPHYINRIQHTSKLYAQQQQNEPPPLPNTDDPYLILGLSTPTADKKQIKRAYKRRALQYHPDVRITSDSTNDEKKQANDDFAKINSAYAILSGKEQASSSSSNGTSSSKGSSKSKAGGYSYQPPHRRSSSSSSYTNINSDDWRDYIPNYDKTDDDDDKYNTNGDSFGAIFTDFVTSAAGVAGAAGSSKGSILNDLISFLEGNFASDFADTSSSSSSNDDVVSTEFLKFLQTASIDDIKNELDDAILLTQQLDQKDTSLQKEYNDLLSQGQQNYASGSSGMGGGGGGKNALEEMRWEESKREIEVRRDVVRDYLDKARTRRVLLKKRYEELTLEDSFNTGGRRSGRSSSASSSTSSSSSSSSSSYGNNAGNTSYQNASSSSTSNDTNKKEEEDAAWKTEGFGSSGRRSSSRGGARRRSSRPSSSPSSSSSSSYSSTSPSSSPSSYTSSSSSRQSYSNTQSSSSSSSSSSNNRRAYSYTPPKSPATRNTSSSSSSNNNNSINKSTSTSSSWETLPPHRRVSTPKNNDTFESRMQDEKRRLREIDVEDEIEKMKRELGL